MDEVLPSPLTLRDLSLISDISDAEDAHPSVECTSLHLGYLGSDASTHSSIISDISTCSSPRQVRFSHATAYSEILSDPLHSSGFDETSTLHPNCTSEDDAEEITTVTVIRDSSPAQQNDTPGVFAPEKYIDPLLASNQSRSSDHPALQLPRDTGGHLADPFNTRTLCPPYTDDGDNDATFFRTSDHLPRPPVRPLNHSLTPLHQTPSESLRTAYGDHSPLPRISPSRQTPFFERPHATEGCYKSDILSDTAFPSQAHSSLYEPRINTAGPLIEQINALSKRLNKQLNSGPTKQAREDAARLVEQACNSLNSHNSDGDLILNPGLTVNIPDQVCTFNNLMELSVSESEIVREERARVAERRKRMAQLRKKAEKEKPDDPPPDLLEFFDPNKHIFQSINLHVRGLPSFLPSLNRASNDFLTVFHDRRVNDFDRIHP
ncbi:unnamed protein product [Dicrocoelium dendriticum]|nr:unnamed protein product [Dicrocoelium dendriticum]